MKCLGHLYLSRTNATKSTKKSSKNDPNNTFIYNQQVSNLKIIQLLTIRLEDLTFQPCYKAYLIRLNKLLLRLLRYQYQRPAHSQYGHL